MKTCTFFEDSSLLISNVDRSRWSQYWSVTCYLHKPTFWGFFSCWFKIFIWYQSPNSHISVKLGTFFVVWEGSYKLYKMCYIVLHGVVTGTCIILSNVFLVLRKEYLWRSENEVKPELTDAVFCLKNLDGKVRRKDHKGHIWAVTCHSEQQGLVSWPACSLCCLAWVWVCPLSSTETGSHSCFWWQLCKFPGFYRYHA